MYFFALALAAAAVYLIFKRLYTKHTFDNVEYNATLSAAEVFEDEDVFLYEELTNNKTLPLPCVRVDTELPDGLKFRLHERNGGNNEPSAPKPAKKRGVHSSRPVNASKPKPEKPGDNEYLKSYVQSIFVLHSRRKITRRWRIACLKRGLYSMSSVILVATDLLGANTQSKRIEIAPGKRNSVTVLPKTIDLEGNFISSYHFNGDKTVSRGLLSDPLRIAGSREYTPLDPMNKINWLSSAAHDRLMVNVEEYAERDRFGLILNMQSRGREHDPHMPSDFASVELCITVCASIFDRMSYGNVPVTMFCNTSPSDAGLPDRYEMRIGEAADDIILRTPAYTGREAMLEAMRLLAVLPMKISCQTDKMLDAVCAEPYKYADGGNIIVVSSYIDERMLNFHRVMQRNGIRVVYYITTANQNAAVIPDDVEVYFKTFR